MLSTTFPVLTLFAQLLFALLLSINLETLAKSYTRDYRWKIKTI